ncbi:hypothetical protein, variant [Aphanomyces astaci]|uniref:Uncharacterized protein n=1 Tax=Aphanomyces astaci TaxID=112090 RepID=W4GA10_APHAT|nr:hypothetical protein, variant [Aphanomyces astaci]ETV76510.1 hypothetical protein, variant [Aphanomyces astaci]|eukprot:XP_009834055.1 hypothetical protein, variant [Aphanomyces astaci]
MAILEFELACGADDTRVLCRIYGGVQFKNVPPTLCHADQLRHQHEHATSLDRVLVTQAWRQMDEAAFIASVAHVFPLYNDPAAMPGLFQLYYRMLSRYNEAQLDLTKCKRTCIPWTFVPV